LGTPSEDDFDFVTDAKAIEYLKSFSPRKRVDFKELYPAATTETIDLLEKCLQFNPKKRITIDEALQHSYFGKVRDKSRQLTASGPVILEFEKEGDLSAERLRDLFLSEIKYYHNSDNK